MNHHGAALRRYLKSDERVERIRTDFRHAGLGTADRIMLEHAVKVAQEPWTVTPEDIEALRRAGFSDADVLDVTQIAAYFSYVNRMALGLGVELEDYWKEVHRSAEDAQPPLSATAGAPGL